MFGYFQYLSLLLLQKLCEVLARQLDRDVSSMQWFALGETRSPLHYRRWKSEPSSQALKGFYMRINCFRLFNPTFDLSVRSCSRQKAKWNLNKLEATHKIAVLLVSWLYRGCNIRKRLSDLRAGTTNSLRSKSCAYIFNTSLNNLAHKSSLLENSLRVQKEPWYIFEVLKYSSVDWFLSTLFQLIRLFHSNK